MEIPLEKKLKKQAHVQVARLQDELMQILYDIDSSLVLHGGTFIWRCYGANRFSEDLDLYFGSNTTENFLSDFKCACNSANLNIDKIKETENLIYAKISDSHVQVRVELNKNQYLHPIPLHYENLNGSKMIIFGLELTSLLEEKILAYNSRRLIRDIYDIYFLSSLLKPNESISTDSKILLSNLPTPLDESNLATIVYSGAIPSFENMLQMLRRRLE